MCPTSIEESVALCFLQVSSLLFLREMWHFPRAQHFWGKCGTFLGLSTLRKMWHFPAPQHFPTGSSLLFFLRVRVKGLGSGCRFRRCYVSSLLWSQRLRRPSLCLYLLMSLSVFLPISIYAYTCLFLPMPIYAYNLSMPIPAYVYIYFCLYLSMPIPAYFCLCLSMPIICLCLYLHTYICFCQYLSMPLSAYFSLCQSMPLYLRAVGPSLNELTLVTNMYIHMSSHKRIHTHTNAHIHNVHIHNTHRHAHLCEQVDQDLLLKHVDAHGCDERLLLGLLRCEAWMCEGVNVCWSWFVHDAW